MQESRGQAEAKQETGGEQESGVGGVRCRLFAQHSVSLLKFYDCPRPSSYLCIWAK